MKTILVILALCAASCSSIQSVPYTDKGFYDTEIVYTNPETNVTVRIPAVVYVKKGAVRSVIVDER